MGYISSITHEEKKAWKWSERKDEGLHLYLNYYLEFI